MSSLQHIDRGLRVFVGNHWPELDPRRLDRHRVGSGTKNQEISLRDFQLFFVQIFARDVVLRYLTGANFLPIAFSGVFDARYDPCLERVSLFQQLVHTFRIDTFNVGQALQISRLQSRGLGREVGRTRLSALAPALPVNPDLGLLTMRLRQSLFLCCGFLRNGFRLRQFLLSSSLLYGLLCWRLLSFDFLRSRRLLLSLLFGSHSRSLAPSCALGKSGRQASAKEYLA